jgi:hypothetical protein
MDHRDNPVPPAGADAVGAAGDGAAVHEPGIFDPPTASALARLRVFLEDARARAYDLSEPGRHLALIALDGVVEYTLWLVAQTISARFKGERPSFGDLMSAVRDRLADAERPWSERGRTGVDQLRRARNDAQHAAVVPDDAQLAAWSDAAHAFIDDLLRTAFGLRADDLVLALAVRDQALRDRLTSAERALDAGDDDIAFSQAWIAFELAVASWRTLRTGRQTPGPNAAARLWLGPDDGVLQRLYDIEETLDVQPFASDMGEYITLAASRAAQGTGWQPEAYDARRALRFAVGWIVRWEAFERGYPGKRLTAWQDSIEPPTIGDGQTAQIAHASAYVVQTAAGSRRWSVHAQLANLPESGRGDWGADMAQCFVDAANERNATLRAQRVALVGRAGRMIVELDPGADVDATVATLRRAVELADERYAWRRAERAARERRREQIEHAWHELVTSAGRGILAVAGVQWELRPDGEHYVVALVIADEKANERELLLAAEVLRSRGGLLAGAGVRDGRVEIDTTALDETGLGAVRLALWGAVEEIARHRELQRAEDERYRRFAIRLEEELGGPPREFTE